ncbi:claudin-4-like [Acipenser ruthenus]|uniref:claudin-4-like n=1 Tax=Acipenser ruthenus TaxID=7906 RepID=UPI00145BA4E5|nr:claudin-4-like [Acipenser ruthenus]
MASTGLQLIGFTGAVTGWVVGIAATALPQWKVTAFIGNNILTSEVIWEGIWMNCIYQTTGHMQCKTYDSMLALPADIQAARALMCFAIFLGMLSILLTCCGLKCTTCARDDQYTKTSIALTGGILFIATGLCILIPVSWTAHTIISDFYNPLVPTAHKKELGQAIYLGWAAAVVLILGGALLSSNCPQSERDYRRGYGRNLMSNRATSPPKPASGGSLPMKEYV